MLQSKQLKYSYQGWINEFINGSLISFFASIFHSSNEYFNVEMATQFKTKNVDFIGFVGQNIPNLHKNKHWVNNIFPTFSFASSIFVPFQCTKISCLYFRIMTGLKKARSEQNDEKTLCLTFDGWPVAVEIVQILAQFPCAPCVKPDNNLINIQVMNRVAVWNWNIHVKNGLLKQKIESSFRFKMNLLIHPWWERLSCFDCNWPS